MQVARLKEYLKMLVDLEKQLYTQEKIIADLEYTIPRLGYRRNICEPQRGSVEVCDNETINFFFVSVVVGIIGIFIKFLRIPCMVIAGFYLLLAAMGYINGSAENDRREQRYREEYQEYKNAVLQDSVRVENELKRKVLLEAQLKKLKSMNAKTKMTLQKLYSRNIIHPKYQGLIPVCSLYGYFDTGVCTQLEGHEGAYNKYDTESRLDYIICKMDEVLKHLEEIKSNQYQLYSAIQESNAQFDKLISNTNYMMGQLDGIQAQGAQLDARVASLQMTSALTLYETACNRQETAYLRRMAEWGY